MLVASRYFAWGSKNKGINNKATKLNTAATSAANFALQTVYEEVRNRKIHGPIGTRSRIAIQVMLVPDDARHLRGRCGPHPLIHVEPLWLADRYMMKHLRNPFEEFAMRNAEP